MIVFFKTLEANNFDENRKELSTEGLVFEFFL